MKKILFALALIATLQVADAQNRGGGRPGGAPGGAPMQNRAVTAAQNALDAALKASQDAKKATKVATWLKLAEAYTAAYSAPSGDGWVGASAQELALILRNARPLSEEQVTLGGNEYKKATFPSYNYYYDANGTLAIIEVTNPIDANALDKALDAYVKAASVDPKGSKKKDIVAGIEGVAGKMSDEAISAYKLGNNARASEYFEKSFRANKTAPADKADYGALYNAGFTANLLGDGARAKKIFEECIANGYTGEDGDVYSKLADAEMNLGNKAAAKEILEKGFAEHPQNQGILVGLINYYLTENEEPARLFELIGEAKKNEPNNASLYYVEGNINYQLGNIDEAVASYEKCAQLNPDYEYGYIGEGVMFYELALKLQDQAQNELDDAKYMALVSDFEKQLKACIAPFEKAFEITKDNDLKKNIAEYLKNACFRFREDPEYQAKYDKYSPLVNG